MAHAEGNDYGLIASLGSEENLVPHFFEWLLIRPL